MNVTMVRCDGCGKLGEVPADEVLEGWRRVPLPFAPAARAAVDACSPGCAKRLLADAVDAEWGVPHSTPVQAPIGPWRAVGGEQVPA
jgi:hypothetical protein